MGWTGNMNRAGEIKHYMDQKNAIANNWPVATGSTASGNSGSQATTYTDNSSTNPYVTVTAAGSTEETNPWDAALKSAYTDATNAGQSANWADAIAQAQALTGKDYTSEIDRMAQEDITKQQADQSNKFGAIGMRELGNDVQSDWAKTRADTSSKSAISGQEMQLSALDLLSNIISGASSSELDAIAKAIDAASAGGSNYNSYADLIMPYLEQAGSPT
jgi:hypothetical protein